MWLKTSKSYHSFIWHQSSSEIECFIYTIRLIKHFHHVIVINSRWFFNFYFLFNNWFNFMHFNFVMKGKFYDFAILYAVKKSCIVLKYSSIARNNLELMGQSISFKRWFFFQKEIFGFFHVLKRWGDLRCCQTIWDSDYHCSSIFKYVHIVRL